MKAGVEYYEWDGDEIVAVMGFHVQECAVSGERTLYAEGFETGTMSLIEDLCAVLGFKVEELREGVR